MKITLLGTSCMVPTKERNVSATHVQYGGEGLLFDCGEGTQRQMNIAGIKRSTVSKIFISHWHADHIAGILGLLQTISNKDTDKTIDIFGPIETKKRMNNLLKTSITSQELHIRIHELKPTQKIQKIFENDEYEIAYISLDHTIPCVGYSLIQKDKRRMKVESLKKYNITPGPILSQFQMGKSVVINNKTISANDVTYIVKGKKFTYAIDTSFCEELVKLSQDTDLLITEATYTEKHIENATKYKHMTAKQAARAADLANAKKLILVHISQRYKEPEEITQEAKEVFENSELGFDFLRLKL